MSRLVLFYRLIVRPLFREPVRLGLTVLAVALGVAVVLAIELAGNAAAGSFHSSLETLTGDNDLEVVAAGGVPENVVVTLARLPYPLQISPRLEDFVVVEETNETLPLIGVDFLLEGGRFFSERGDASAGAAGDERDFRTVAREWRQPTSIWVGESLGK